MIITPHCTGCDRDAGDIPDLVEMAKINDYPSAAAFVRGEEGTYNPINGHFLCDTCYIRAGVPSSPNGWRAP